MVQIRKPVKLSDDLIDRRRPGSARYMAQRRAAEAKRLAEEVLSDSIIEAMKLRNRRPR